MTLFQMSYAYKEEAHRLSLRVTALRETARHCQNAEDARRLRRRIGELAVLLQENRELACLTEHYYDRGYYRNGKYTL